MTDSIHDIIEAIEARGLLTRSSEPFDEAMPPHLERLIGQPLPPDLIEFYRERVESIGLFDGLFPIWNDFMGRWLTEMEHFRVLRRSNAVPLFEDGGGNYFGLDLTAGGTAVYFFDHADDYKPQDAAGSTLAKFLLILAEVAASEEGDLPSGRAREIDPDIDKCPRAEAGWG